MNERPVDIQSRGVTEPQRDAGKEADWGIEKCKNTFRFSFIPLRLVVPPRHLPLQQGEAELASANF